MLMQGHLYCRPCRRAFDSRFTFCPGCRASVSVDEIILLDTAYEFGFISDFSGISFDPWDGNFAVNIPGTDLAIEPDGQVDVVLPGGIDAPLDFDGDDGGFWDDGGGW